jgi:hypothetical protein
MRSFVPAVICRIGNWLALALALVGAPGAALAADEGWRLEPDARIEIGVVSAQTTTRDEELVIDGEAITLRGQIGLALNNGTTRLRIEADRIESLRLGEGREDVARDRFTATFETDIAKSWELQLQARHYDDYVSVEAADTDEWNGSVRIGYEPDNRHRVRLTGTWRAREYDTGAGAETTGEGPRVDAQYRRRFGRYHYLTFDLRAENIRSDDPMRGYERESANLSYTHPIGPDLRVRPAIEVIQTRFDGRLTDTGALRRDRLTVPEVEVLWWPGKWRFEAEAKYIFTDSNEARREREGYRLTVSVGYAF